MPFKNVPDAYYVWASMKDRCSNPNCVQYHNYGGRGITVCDKWKASFKAFIQDMGPRPAGYSIDRIDVDGNYEPGNCRWADEKTQQRNRRDAAFVEIGGVKYRAIELAELAEKKTDTIIDRAARGLSYEEVISKDVYSDTSSISIATKNSAEKRRSMTHCKRGHEFSDENTLVSKRDGSRHCRQCHNAKMRRRNQAKRASLNAGAEEDTLDE